MALTFLPGSGSLYPIPYRISSLFPFQNHLNSICLKLNWSLLPAKSLSFWYYLALRMSPLMVKIRSIASGLLVPIHTHAGSHNIVRIHSPSYVLHPSHSYPHEPTTVSHPKPAASCDFLLFSLSTSHS